ncbi:MAG: NAD(P)H-hydrate epimerase [bacterium]
MSKIPIPEQYNSLPVVVAEKMRELDRRATQEYGISPESLMENAGRAVAEEFLKVCIPALAGSPGDIKAVICCGRGNNGGDGLVAGRYLRQAGAAVEAFMLSPKKETGFAGLVAINLEKAREKGVDIFFMEESGLTRLESLLASCTAVLDALLGTGSAGKPEGAMKRVIQVMNRSGRPIAAIDIPSGLQPDTGHHSGVFIKARWTFTLGLVKRGLLAPHAAPNVGELKVLDIGYPAELVRR